MRVFRVQGEILYQSCSQWIDIRGGNSLFCWRVVNVARAVAIHNEFKTMNTNIRTIAPFSSRTTLYAAAILLLTMAALPVILRVGPAPEPSDIYRQQLARDNMDVLRIALDQLRKDTGRYPFTHEGLVALIHNLSLPGWNGPYIFELKPDPWKRRFEYESDGQQIKLYSAGPDGIPGNDDDLFPVPVSL